MSNVRAKFECVSVEPGDEGNQVVLQVVVGGSPENDSFFKWTPYGRLEMGIVNEAVKFEVGKEYYLDFTPADSDAA